MNMTPHPVTIRPYAPDDLDTVISIFQRAIREVACRDYTSGQVAAWSQVDRDGWALARGRAPTFVAMRGGQAAGFADLLPDGLVDMLFVHPLHQGAGVATALLAEVETLARASGQVLLTTEASLTARPFFERRGFAVVAELVVEKRGQFLRNFRMIRRL